MIYEILNKLRPLDTSGSLKNYKQLIKYVNDRPGHDKRYAIDPCKLK